MGCKVVRRKATREEANRLYARGETSAVHNIYPPEHPPDTEYVLEQLQRMRVQYRGAKCGLAPTPRSRARILRWALLRTAKAYSQAMRQPGDEQHLTAETLAAIGVEARRLCVSYEAILLMCWVAAKDKIAALDPLALEPADR